MLIGHWRLAQVVLISVLEGSEIKINTDLNVKDIQKEADNIAKQVRLLDNLLQSANWTTELIES